MNLKHVARSIIIAAAGIAPMSHASEQEDARALCVQATTRFMVAEGAPASIDVAKLCEHNVQPAAAWRCAIQRMDRGEEYNFATSRCGMGS